MTFLRHILAGYLCALTLGYTGHDTPDCYERWSALGCNIGVALGLATWITFFVFLAVC